MGNMARGVGSNDVGGVLKQVVKTSNVIARVRHAPLLCPHMQWQQIVHRGRSVMSTIAFFNQLLTIWTKI